MTNAKTPITVLSTFQSLRAAGYPPAYINKLLPDWWDNSLLKTSAGSFQFALILKQRLGLEVNFGEDGELAVETPAIHANFKHRADTEAAELNVSARLGIALAHLACFAISEPYRELPADPAEIYAAVCAQSDRRVVDFEGLLDLCWSHGIPVLFLSELPSRSKRATGMAVMVENRPSILLGFNYSDHSKQLFVLAHELAHVVLGHVQNNGAVVDEDIADISEGLVGRVLPLPDEQEVEADAFALSLIRNEELVVGDLLPRQTSAATLAMVAMRLGEERSIDAGHLMLSYAKEHDDWIKANQALNFIERHVDALGILKDKFEEHTDLSKLSDENAEHLRYMQGI